MKHIKQDNKVSIYFALPNDVKGIMIQGKAEIVEDIEFKLKIWMDNWTIYYPQGYTDPDFTILKITPTLLKGWFKGHLYYDFSED